MKCKPLLLIIPGCPYFYCAQKDLAEKRVGNERGDFQYRMLMRAEGSSYTTSRGNKEIHAATCRSTHAYRRTCRSQRYG